MAAVLLACVLIPVLSLTLRAKAEGANAHTINVFDIDVKNGADYYYIYEPEDSPYAHLNEAYVWQAENAEPGHKFVYNIKLSISGEGTSEDLPEDASEEEKAAYEAARKKVGDGFIEIRIPKHILKFKGQTAAGIPVDGVYPDTIENACAERRTDRAAGRYR